MTCSSHIKKGRMLEMFLRKSQPAEWRKWGTEEKSEDEVGD